MKREPNMADGNVTTLHPNSGNTGKSRRARTPPGTFSVPRPPDFLSAAARTEWRRVVPILRNLGVLSTLDRGVLAAYCQAYGRWIQAERALARMARNDPGAAGMIVRTAKGGTMQNPLVGTANKAAKDMQSFASELGLTPIARTRIEIGSPAGGADRYFT